MLPNFLIVGAEKAGTTALSTMLSRHPDVFMCNPKEPRFFSQNWNRGLSWYESLFNGSDSYKAIGEASPAYTWAPESIEVPKRIYQCLGDIKYIYIVRNPIDRMISHYQHALFYRWIPDHTPFEVALEMIPGIKNCSQYFYQIKQYLSYTQRQQWHIVVLEELIKDYNQIANEMFRFLEIDEISLTQLPSENISAEKVRPPMLIENLKFLQIYLPSPLIQFGKKLLNKHKLGKEIAKPNISECMRNSLMEELEPDIQRLSDFYGKDFHTILYINSTSHI